MCCFSSALAVCGSYTSKTTLFLIRTHIFGKLSQAETPEELILGKQNICFQLLEYASFWPVRGSPTHSYRDLQQYWLCLLLNFVLVPFLILLHCLRNVKSVMGEVPTSRFVHKLGLQEAQNEGEVVFCRFWQHLTQQQCISILHDTTSPIRKKVSLPSKKCLDVELRDRV